MLLDLANLWVSPVFQTGIHPTLVKVLTKHSALRQNTSDADVAYKAFSNLLTCRNAYTALASFVQVGRLPEAMKAVEQLESLVVGVPEFLKQTPVIGDLKVISNSFCGASFLISWSQQQKLTSTRARVQDQLSDAYSKSVSVSATEIVILSQVQGKPFANYFCLSLIG